MTEKEQMLISILKCRRIDLYTRTLELTKEQQQQYEKMVKRRKAGEPLQYIIGFCDFFGYRIFLDDRVLIPRPETEILIEEVLTFMQAQPQKEYSVLDIGTGSGNIPIALTKERANCHVTAVDISEDALCLAKDNARFNSVDDRIDFVGADMNAYLSEALRQGEKFDIIVSNPPYIPTAQLEALPADVKREPLLALDGGSDGMMFYRLIVEKSHQLLNPQGAIFLEMGDGQKDLMHDLFALYPQFISVSHITDYTNTPRIFKGMIK